MYSGLKFERTVEREKQRNLQREAEHKRAIRLARAARRRRVKAGPRAWNWPERWPYQLCLGERTDRGPRIKHADPYLLNALAWMMAKE